MKKKAQITKDTHGNKRVAEPATLGVGSAAAITAIASGNWQAAIAIEVVAVLPYILSLVTDARRS